MAQSCLEASIFVEEYDTPISQVGSANLFVRRVSLPLS